MKNNFFILIICLLATGFSKAQSNSKSERNASEITFVKTEHNFGTIKQGEDCVYEFVYKNTGKNPLVINNVQATCGCTIPTWSKAPLLKGKKDKISVKYDSNRVGAFSKQVTITSNAKNSPVIISITGVIE